MSTCSSAGKKTSSVLSFFRGTSREKSPSRLGGVLGKYSVDSVKYMPRLDPDTAEETGTTRVGQSLGQTLALVCPGWSKTRAAVIITGWS